MHGDVLGKLESETRQTFEGGARQRGIVAIREAVATPASGDLLVRRATSLGTVLLRCSFLINGVNGQDHTRALKRTDELDVLPPFAGR